MKFFFKKILNFFDFFHKKKIIKNLKKINSNGSFKVILDVGAHEGESIELFLKNFDVEHIYSFEPSQFTFKILMKNCENLKKKFTNTKIHLENVAIGYSTKDVELNYLKESSSSTLRDLNIDSKYFKKKEKYLGKLFNKKVKVQQINFKEYLEKNKIKKIDFLKIDTEGYELEVLKGLEDFISKVSIILFEHHFDNMIVKNYTFNDINNLLKNNGFNKFYKVKMPFRKSFDYIYVKD